MKKKLILLVILLSGSIIAIQAQTKKIPPPPFSPKVTIVSPYQPPPRAKPPKQGKLKPRPTEIFKWIPPPPPPKEVD